MGEKSKHWEFEKKYRPLFEKLDQEPDKEKRWQMLFSDRALYEEFCCDFVREYPGYHYDEKGKRHKEYDGLAFRMALEKAIGYYHLDNDKNASFHTFFQSIYKREGTDNIRKENGLPDKVLNLVKLIQKIQQMGEDITAENIIRKYGKDFEREGICKIFKGPADTSGKQQLADVPLKAIAYLKNQKSNSLDDENTFEEPADYAAAELLLEVEEKADIRTYEEIGEILRCEVAAAKAKQKQWEFYRAFWTKDVMSVMKLEEGKQPYREHPAGDTEMYQMLKRTMGRLWNQVAYRPYIENTIEVGPKNREYLYGQYYNRLSTSDITSLRMLSRIMGVSEKTLRSQEKGNQKNYSLWKQRVLSEIESILRGDGEQEISF